MALTTDAELTRPATGALRPEDAAGLAAPTVLAPEDAAGLAAPKVLAPEDAAGLAAPKVLAPEDAAGLAAPKVLAPISSAGMAAPNVLAPIAPLSAPYPLNHARIGYESAIQSASLSASTGLATVAALSTVSTWERWVADAGGSQTITATFSAARAIDYVGLASYDLAGGDVLVQYSPDLVSGFTTVATITPGADGAIMRLFNAVTARRVRLSFSRAAPVSLGVWFMGSRLDMEQPFYGGFKPPTLNRRTAYDNEISTAGQMLGRNINRQGIACSVSLNNLSSDWYRTYFDPFVLHAIRKPFFLLWNPLLYPNECIYGSANDDIAPTNIGGRLKVSVSFDMEGYA